MEPLFRLSPVVRRWVRRIHLVLAFTVGLVLVVSGLSGSLLVYHPEIDRALNPGLWRVKAEEIAKPLDASFTAVRKAFPGETIRSVRLPREPGDTLEFWVRSGGVVWKAYVDPYTARIVGVRGEHDGLMGTLHDLHVHLLAGETGETVMGAIGLVFLILLGTGLVLWWPRGVNWRGAFRIRWKENRAKRVYSLHRFIGIVSIGFLLLSTLTGAGMVFHHTTNAVLGAVLGGPLRPSAPPQLDRPLKEPPLSVSQLVERARTLIPGAAPTWIKPPTSSTAPFVVRMRFPDNPHPNGTTYVTLHPGDGQPLSVHSFAEAGAGQRASDLKYPLHIGRFWGEGGRILTIIIGIMPWLLFVTGFSFWRARHSATSKGGSVPARPIPPAPSITCPKNRKTR